FDATEGPADWVGPSNLVGELYLIGRTAAAYDAALRVLRTTRNLPTLVNMAVILETLGRFDESLLYAREAYLTAPADPRTQMLYGQALLRFGRLAEGWPLYACAAAQSFADLSWMPIPEWQGAHQSLASRRILVVEGGGYGDNIYFLRWLDTLRRWG